MLRPAPPPRSGAVLITAIIILTALMLIGIPFLASQREALAGSQAFKARREADTGRQSALDLGLGIAAYAFQLQLADPASHHTMLFDDIDQAFATTTVNPVLLPSAEPAEPQVVQLDPALLELPDHGAHDVDHINEISPQGSHGIRSYLGVHLEDEGGKLDVNQLDAEAWDTLLRAVGIADWDDGNGCNERPGSPPSPYPASLPFDYAGDPRPYDSQDVQHDPPGNQYHSSDHTDNSLDTDPPTWHDDDDRDGTYYNGDNDDRDNIGELAEALARVRYRLPGERITELEQLLQADPYHNKDLEADFDAGYTYAQEGGTDHNGAALSGLRYGFRHPLTRAELERLRPYLSVHSQAQARGGIIDIGTVITMFDSQPVPDGPVDALFAPKGGTRIVGGAYDPGTGEYERYRLSAHDFHSGQDVADTDLEDFREDDPLAIEAASPVNLHHAPPPVRRVIAGGSAKPFPLLTGAGALAPVLRPSHLGFDAPSGEGPGVFWPYTDPRFTGRELPTAGLRTYGLVSVRGGASTTDVRQRPLLETSQRIVAQATPPESDIVATWDRQDLFAVLSRARHGSGLVSWPRPVDRITDADFLPLPLPEDTDGDDRPDPAPATPDLATGLRAQALDLLPAMQHLDRSFTRSFAGSEADFLKQRHDTSGKEPASGDYTVDDLTPDGLRLRSDGHLAYDPHDGDSRYLIHGDYNASENSQIEPGHLAFWLKPEEVWLKPEGDEEEWSGETLTLLDLRMPRANAGLPLLDVALAAGRGGNPAFDPRTPETFAAGGSPEADITEADIMRLWAEQANVLQNHWSLSYDGASGHLVLRIVNPGIPRPGDYGPYLQADDPATPHVDESCLSQPGGHRLAPHQPLFDDSGELRPGAVVEHRYKIKLEKDRWYHIQLAMANDRPQQQAIVVDNRVGRNLLTTIAAGGSVDDERPGDHLTLPALLLDQDLPAIDPVIGLGDGAEAYDQVIQLRALLPGNLNADLREVLPASGSVRIGNEHITYTGLTANTITGCRRGMRQDTFVEPEAPSDPWDAATKAKKMRQRWPAIPAHERFARVYPAGLRLSNPAHTLLRGGATLAEPSAVGDPRFHYLTWGYLSPNLGVDGDNDEIPEDPPPAGDGVPEFIYDGSVVRLHTDSPDLVWPERGIVRIIRLKQDWETGGGWYFAYDNSAVNRPSATQPFINVTHGPLGWPKRNENLQWDPSADASKRPIVVLISMELATNGVDPRESGVYSKRGSADFADTLPAGVNRKRMVMLYDADPTSASFGRIDWLTFHTMVQGPDGASGDEPWYLIDYDGFRFDPHPKAHGVSEGEPLFPTYMGWYKQRHRGLERTAGPDVDVDGDDVPDPFPAGTRVTPVQTPGNSAIFKALVSGDVLTILPKANPALSQPVADTGGSVASQSRKGGYQVVVRYSPTDGLVDWDGGDDVEAFDPSCDTHNHYFALCEALPNESELLDLSACDVLIGTGWNGRDIGNYPLTDGVYDHADKLIGNQHTDLRSLLPYANWFKTDTHAPRVYIGCADDRTSHNSAAEDGIAATIDQLCAGRLLESEDHNRDLTTIPGQLVAFRTIEGDLLKDAGGDPLRELPAGEGLDDATWLELDLKQIREPFLDANKGKRGLLLIGGEVVAFDSPHSVYDAGDPLDPDDDTLIERRWGAHVRIIGRGLLGTASDRPLRRGAPVLRLPLGPVVRLDQDVAIAHRGEIELELLKYDDDGDDDEADEHEGADSHHRPFPLPNPLPPAFLACRPDGSAYGSSGAEPAHFELLTCVRHDNRIFTAPWLRGLYGTEPQELQQGDLLIGFWPRHRSGLPPASSPHSIADERRMLRSRSYAWAGFPLRLYGTCFHSSIIDDDPVVIDIADDAGLSLYATGLAGGGFDWNPGAAESIATGSHVVTPSPFDWQWGGASIIPSYREFLPDGGELRLFWRYPGNVMVNRSTFTDQMQAAATNAGRTPQIRAVTLRCKAATRILEREAAQ